MKGSVVHEFDNPTESPSGRKNGHSERIAVMQNGDRFWFAGYDELGLLDCGKRLLCDGAAEEISRLVKVNRELLDAAESALRVFDGGPIGTSREHTGTVAALRESIAMAEGRVGR